MSTDTRAKIVRDALKHIATETTSPKIMTAALSLATAGDAVLAKLGEDVEVSRWGTQPRYPDKKESVESATIRLKMLLAGCTDAALAGFTIDHLVATHRAAAKTAEYELLMARNRRSGAVR